MGEQIMPGGQDVVVASLREMEQHSRADAELLSTALADLDTEDVRTLLAASLNGVSALAGMLATIIERGGLHDHDSGAADQAG
jgi:hypothetical protein